MSASEMPPADLPTEATECAAAAGTPPPSSGGLASVASQNAVWAIAARLSAVVVGMVLIPFVLHKLGRELYGVVVAATSIFEYMSLIRGGIGGALRRYVTLHLHGGRWEAARDFYAAGFWWSNILRGVMLVVGIVLALPLCGFLRLPEAVRPDAAIGVGLVFLAAIIADQGNVFSIPIYATGRTVWLSVVNAIGTWGRLGLTFLALSLLVPTLRVYGFALVLAQLVSVAALVILAQRTQVVGPVLPRPQLGSPQLRRELFSYGGLALLSQAASLLYVSTDNILIGRLYGVSAVTHYSLGTRWAPIITGFMGATMSGLMPMFTSFEARGRRPAAARRCCAWSPSPPPWRCRSVSCPASWGTCSCCGGSARSTPIPTGTCWPCSFRPRSIARSPRSGWGFSPAAASAGSRPVTSSWRWATSRSAWCSPRSSTWASSALPWATRSPR